MGVARTARLIAGLVGVGILGAAWPAGAQAVLTPVGSKPPRTRAVSAWIVWNPSTLQQDLILGARFESAGSPFAWVLPFPSEPTLTRVDADLRLALSKLIAGYQARTPGWRMPPDPPGGPRPWIVFDETDTPRWTTVQAVEPDAAQRLLGLRARQGAIWEDWVGRYAESRAWLVGMRHERSATESGFAYVRIRFATDRPYLPYREPPWSDVAEGSGPRSLRVTVIAPELVEWKLGRSLPTTSNAWLSFEPTHEELRGAFGEALYGELFDAGERYWLRSFEDWHEVHAGNDDVTFARAGAVPVQGAPGTVKDAKGEGVALEPVGPAPASSVAVQAGVVGESAQEGVQLPQRARGTRRRGMAYGVMVLIALGAAWWLARGDRKPPRKG